MTQDETDLLFVYGSLMRGGTAGGVLHSAVCLGAARVRGFALYNLGDHPGLYPSDEGCRVEGEMFRMSEPAATLLLLDDYENAPGLYRRQQVDVMAGDRTAKAWVYVLTEDPRGRYPRIPEGQWPNHRRERPGFFVGGAF